VIFTSILYFILLFRCLSATFVCSSSLCDLVCLSCFGQVFVQFRLSDQLRSSGDLINEFDVVYVADPDEASSYCFDDVSIRC